MKAPDPRRNPGGFLRYLFERAVEEADPARTLAAALPARPKGRTVVVGAGKASGAMARAVELAWEDQTEGLVIVPHGTPTACERIEVVQASHPVPDQAGHGAARRILRLCSDLGENDLLVCLVSGGGSSLLALPLAGLILEDLQAVNQALLNSGATISEMNVLRKHLSAVKGGRLAAAAWPARCVTLLISDVPGDDPGIIASGPTVPDPSTLQEARDIVERYGLQLPGSVIAALGKDGRESPGPGDPRLARAESRMIARPMASLEAAATAARAAGMSALILSDRIEGEARDVGSVHAAIALAARDAGRPLLPPCVILSGGETTVTLRGEGGRGGRNAEFALALAIGLNGADRIHAIACDTDGIDGSESNAGVVVGPETLRGHPGGRAGARQHLAAHDSWTFFNEVNGLVVTGPTETNVNDFRALLVLPE